MPPENAPAGRKQARIFRAKIFIVVLAFLAAGLAGARLYLPFWVKDHVNAQLAALNGYEGSVGGIGIALWRGAYQIHDLHIYKTKGDRREPFIAAKTTDLSVEWRALWKGRVVAQAALQDIDVNFTASQTGSGNDWGNFIGALSPFDINRMTVNRGKVAYRDHRAKSGVDIYIRDIRGSVTNLRNTERKEEGLPSGLQVSGMSIGRGGLDAKGRINILKAVPDFDVDVELKNAALPAFNDFTQSAAGVEFARGTASVFSELTAADGRLKGYIKFLAVDVAVEAPDDPGDNILDAAWTALAAAFMEVFKNHPKDQFALRIPLEGNMKNPEQDGWSAFFSIFSNAFGKAFTRGTDGTINFPDALPESDREE